jgi:hypothetical protein
MRRVGLIAMGLLIASLAWLARPRPGESIGRVESAEGPLAGVPVRLKGGDVLAKSDAGGTFSLPHAARGKTITAWKEGFFIAGARASGPLTWLRLEPLPAEDHDGYAWVNPTPRPGDEKRCGNCHGEIYREWSESAHSRSAIGLRFVAAYADLLRERPDGAGVCASCHAPGLRDDDPARFDLRDVAGVDRHGVHCDFCHKVAGLADGDIGLTHGRFLLRLLRPRDGQLFFGPLDDVDRGEDAYSPFYRDSRYCAACHEGVVFGVRVYGTYSEWRDSPAAKAGQHCQHCHMKPTGRMTNVAPGRGGIDRDPRSLGNHRFWAGSQLEMLRGCLRLEARVEGSRAIVRLLADGVGHRVPTGFVERQLLLVVEGRDNRGQPVPRREGPTLPDAAGPEFAGRPGRLYGRLLKDEHGRGPVPFWKTPAEDEDTRLAPGVADECTFLFASPPASVRVRVVHRRVQGADGGQLVLHRSFRGSP